MSETRKHIDAMGQYCTRNLDHFGQVFLVVYLNHLLSGFCCGRREVWEMLLENSTSKCRKSESTSTPWDKLNQLNGGWWIHETMVCKMTKIGLRDGKSVRQWLTFVLLSLQKSYVGNKKDGILAGHPAIDSSFPFGFIT
jgi:hypothetical protein